MIDIKTKNLRPSKTRFLVEHYNIGTEGFYINWIKRLVFIHF